MQAEKYLICMLVTFAHKQIQMLGIGKYMPCLMISNAENTMAIFKLFFCSVKEFIILVSKDLLFYVPETHIMDFIQRS
jgi:hypothetical protein